MKFKVCEDFFKKIPNACFGVIIINNFDNTKSYNFITDMLNENVANTAKEFNNVKVKESNLIKPYREAFKLLDINPNKYMCSIEALVSRITKKNELPSINPIVDLANALSLKYCLPIGVHDIDRFDGDIEIRYSNELDTFIPFGETSKENVDLNEIVYVSGNDVKTRRWTWRQGENSKITNSSKNLFIPIDGFSDINKDKVICLQNELVNILKEKYNINADTGYVDINNKEFTIKKS